MLLNSINDTWYNETSNQLSVKLSYNAEQTLSHEHINSHICSILDQTFAYIYVETQILFPLTVILAANKLD